MKVRQVALLSTLIIDIAKDWGGYKIVNLGAPTGAAEALRYGDEGLIDHDSLLNYVASKHLTLPAAIAAVLTDHTKAAHDPLNIDADTVDGEHAAAIVTDARVKAHFPDTLAAIISDLPVAAWATIFSSAFPVATVLSDHNLAAHPLAIVPTMDDAHVPDLNTLSGYPATDPVAGTGGLRTLGAGAQQAAAGNHTHTLTAEAQSATFTTAAPDSYSAMGQRADEEIPAGGDLDPFITKTDTFSALSKAVAGFAGLLNAIADTMKVRLFMDGVQVSESAYVPSGTGKVTVLGSRSLSGSKVVKATVHNYSGEASSIMYYSVDASANKMHPALVVGSVAV